MTLAGSSGILSLHCCIRSCPQDRGDDICEDTGCHGVDAENHRQQVRVNKVGGCCEYQLLLFTVSSRDRRDRTCWELGLSQPRSFSVRAFNHSVQNMRAELLFILNSFGGEASTQTPATRSGLVGVVPAAGKAARHWFLLSFLLPIPPLLCLCSQNIAEAANSPTTPAAREIFLQRNILVMPVCPFPRTRGGGGLVAVRATRCCQLHQCGSRWALPGSGVRQC